MRYVNQWRMGSSGWGCCHGRLYQPISRFS
jgi:hypothetical protein